MTDVRGLYLKMQCPDGTHGGFITPSLRAWFWLRRLGYRFKLVTYAAIERAAAQRDEQRGLLDKAHGFVL